jgi:hypothetical protein
MNVRTLRADETFPVGFETGFEEMPVMKNWVWIAEEDGEVAGVLIGAPMHGIVYVLRLCTRAGAPGSTAFLLLRHFMRDCAARGIKGYILHIDPTLETMRRLIPLCKRAGGVQLNMPQIMLAGKTAPAAQF